MGTLVTGGQGLAVVVATGSATEVGRLQALLDETTSPQTPIERQLRHTGDQLVVICGAVCGIVFLIGFLRGYGFLQMVRTSISLAASAVPEGLPAAATINFALGIRNMKKHHVLLRHLQAVETLGAVQTVCLDKTGTITENRMSVLKVFAGNRSFSVDRGRFFLEGTPIEPLRHRSFSRLADACVLCNEVKIDGCGDSSEFMLSGTPTECALVELAAASGIDVVKLRETHRLIQINHRSENRLFMSTLHQGPQARNIFSMKGSPPEVLGLCRWHYRGGRVVPLTEQDRLRIETENQRMAGDALRVLGVAHKPVDGTGGSTLEEDLIWLGLVGMADPIRKGVRELIDVYHRAGIETVMITGDQGGTAYAVARELNLSQGEPLEILDSSQLAAVDPKVLQALAQKVKVYSRVSPAHKLKIVQALQASGRVVAMTGDGINDGPALKAADIGIAMGRSGTDLARDVADVVLEDDRLETLIIAVRDGRTTYNNIRKSVHFFLSTNLTEIMVMFAAMAGGLGFPLNVMQLLWINIISDIFPGLALSMEAPEPDVLDQPPRDPHAPLLSRRDFATMARESAVISASSLGAYGYGILRYGMGNKAGSIAFQSLTMAQLFHALSCRSERHSVFDAVRPPANPYLTLALGGSIALQVLTMIVPGLRGFLGLSPLGATDLLVVGGSAVLPFVVNETLKGASRKNKRATA
jgi:Ca2+-transporting ATPase